VRAASTLLGAALLVAAAAAAVTSTAGAATRLFVVNHVASNDVRGMATWGGAVALATNGGVVFADTTTLATTQVLRSSAGLPTNNLLAVVASPGGLLWIGTAGSGVSRMRPDGTFLRTLTTFDGLPGDRVQAFLRSGDSIWVATNGGVALFTENPATGQPSLRRSDSKASTGGGIASDDVTSLAIWGDTLWCGTDSGLSSFASGVWTARGGVTSERVQALLVARDSLWIGTKTALRVYAPGSVSTRGIPAETIALAAIPGGVGRGTTIGAYLEAPDGTETSLGTTGLRVGRVQVLLATPASRVMAATPAGLARFVGGAALWEPIRAEGPEVNGGSKVAARGRNVWVTLGNGAPPGLSIGTLLRYDGNAWSTITTASSGGALQSTGAIGILASNDERVWVGHCCSPAAGPTRPRIDRWDPVADLWDAPAAFNIFALAQAPSGRVYAAGVEHENGVYVFDGGSGALLDSLTPGNTGGGLTTNNLRGIAFDVAGRAWIGTVDNGVDRWDGRGTDAHGDDLWTHFGPGFPDLQVTSVAAVSPNDAWIGTQGGVARVANDALDLAATSSANAAIQNRSVSALAVDSEGAVWIATTGGLTRVATTGTIESFDIDDGLADNDVLALSWDGIRNALWAVTAGGVSEIYPSSTTKTPFGDGSFVYPNPATAANQTLRVGGITGEVVGEIRDLAGNRLRSFRADPATPVVWDFRDGRGTRVAPGLYLVVLRRGDLTRVLRVAVTS
jgi:hypothetical protein